MKTRVITAIVALIVFLPLLFLGGDYFKFTTFALGVMAMYEIVRMTFKEINIVVLGLSSLVGALLFLNEEISQLQLYGLLFLILVGMLATVVATGHEIKLVENWFDYICNCLYFHRILLFVYDKKLELISCSLFIAYNLVY